VATPLSPARRFNELIKAFARTKAAWRFASRRSPYHLVASSRLGALALNVGCMDTVGAGISAARRPPNDPAPCGSGGYDRRAVSLQAECLQSESPRAELEKNN
jgi:hypothetical protein